MEGRWRAAEVLAENPQASFRLAGISVEFRIPPLARAHVDLCTNLQPVISGKGPELLGVGMVAGRVVRFDTTRGYGFIAPDHGGEDVFLHVNDMLIPESYIRSGTAVEFEIEDGDRGPKASSVQLAKNADGTPVTPPRSAAARQAAGDETLCDVLDRDEYLRDVTEVLLEAAPSLTGTQIVQLRTALLQFAKGHGWAEG